MALKSIAFFLLSLALLSLASPSPALAQSAFKVLHFTKTSGFDHKTRDNSLQMFRTLGTAHNFTVDHDNTGAAFNSLESLRQYAVVVFSNTTGNNLLTAAQRANFEAYINGGGSLLGIHSASDTYRHSSANISPNAADNRGTWDWYAELLGASVRENPHHVKGTPRYSMAKIGTHPSTANLPNPWAKDEEYYYWKDGYYNPANQAVLEVEQTVGPNGQVNAYDQKRPMSWHRDLPSGGRVFYTALGHRASDYVNDQNFIAHIRDAVLWIASSTLTSARPGLQSADLGLHLQNPARRHLRIAFSSPSSAPLEISVLNLAGQRILTRRRPAAEGDVTEDIDLSQVAGGLYLLQVIHGPRVMTRKLVVGR